MKDYENFVARMGSFDMDLTTPETDQDLLNHFGVKGMKWGVRKKRETKGRSKSSKKAGPYTYTDTDGNTWTTSSPMTRAKEMERRAKYDKDKKSESKSTETKPRTITTKHGTEISFSKDKTPALAKLIAKMSPKVRTLLENSENMTIKGPDGKTVGEMQLYKEGKDSLNVVWVGVRNKERGKGYASAAMQGAVQFAKENNMKQVTLEVPGNSPDALHIYEKMGFKKGKSISDDDDVWGGLTEMKLDLNDTIKHYGVKGMSGNSQYAWQNDGSNFIRQNGSKAASKVVSEANSIKAQRQLKRHL